MSTPQRNIDQKHLWQLTPVRDIFVLLLVVFFLWFILFLSGIFLPIFLALVLANIFNPLITFLELHPGWPRPLTITLLLAITFIGLIAFFVWFGPLLFNQFTDLIGKLPEYLGRLAAGYNLEIGDILERAQKTIQTQQILANIFRTTGRAVGIITLVFGTVLYFIVTLLLIVLSFFFFAWHFNSALEKLKGYIPNSRKERVCRIAARMDRAVGDFFRGRLVIAAVVGVLLSIGWLITGVPYWFFLGMVTGMLNIFPYLASIGWPAAILLKYADAIGAGQSADLLSVVIWPSVVYLLVQFLDGWILTPWIQSGESSLGAATILIVVFIGGALAGIWGLLFAIPVAACIKILLDEVVFPRLKHWAESH